MLVGACSGAVSVGDPIARRLSWFDYVTGVDFRRACAASARERYRLVFNADFMVHVRTYDLVADDAGALVTGRVFRGGFSIDRAFPSLLEGFIGQVRQAQLSAGAFADVRRALADSRPYHEDSPVYLRSDSFYWAVLSCVDGQLGAQGFTGPKEALEALPFRPILLANDPTGVPIRVQRTVPADRATDFGAAYSPMESESTDRARGAGSALFQFLVENGRIRAVGG
jgi:hypothetical protein